jgi:uroporphyrinogen decarboxylase
MTMAVEMTSRERVNRMMRREDQDRIPRADGYWNETIQRWLSEGMAQGEHRQRLKPDFVNCGGASPVPFPGRHDIVEETDDAVVFTDPWGQTIKHFRDRSGAPQHMGFECDSREAWEKRIKPRYLEREITVDARSLTEQFADARRDNLWVHMNGLETFEATRRLMGDEITLVAMAEDPEWIVDVSRTYTDIQLKTMDAQLETGIEPDGLWIYGDMAYRSATMCSPAMYRELIWPDHKRLADWAHAHGMPFIFHTDGDVNAVLDLYLEAGFDCLQPLESKANMDVRKLAPVYGDRLALFGNIDVMVMGTNDREKIEHEVRTKLEAGMATKGYAYHSDHSVPPTTSWESYKFIMELIDKHGRYA